MNLWWYKKRNRQQEQNKLGKINRHNQHKQAEQILKLLIDNSHIYKTSLQSLFYTTITQVVSTLCHSINECQEHWEWYPAVEFSNSYKHINFEKNLRTNYYPSFPNKIKQVWDFLSWNTRYDKQLISEFQHTQIFKQKIKSYVNQMRLEGFWLSCVPVNLNEGQSTSS